MKLFTRSLKIVFVIWICLLSLVDFKTVSGSVLCLGEGKHVALEQAQGGYCSAKVLSNVGIGAFKGHPSQCTDLRISAPFNNLPAPSKNIASQVLIVPAIAFLQPAFAQAYAVLTPPAISDDSPPSEKTLASRQSIVILV